jgi:hypothetical protein
MGRFLIDVYTERDAVNPNEVSNGMRLLESEKPLAIASGLF